MWQNPQSPADLLTYTEEFLNGKLHFSAVCIVFLWYGEIKLNLKCQDIKTVLSTVLQHIWRKSWQSFTQIEHRISYKFSKA